MVDGEAGRPFDKVEFLKQFPLFAHLSPAEIHSVAAASRLIEIKKDEVIYREDEAPDAFYIMASGRVEVVSQIGAPAEQILRHLHRGDYFGEISLLTGQRHSASVRARNDSLVLKIAKPDFDRILIEVPSLGIHFSRVLGMRLRDRPGQKAEVGGEIAAIYNSAAQVGKTFFAVNLALGLRQQTKQKVILVDMSTTAEELSRLFQSARQICTLPLRDITLETPDWLEPCVTHHESGVDLLSISHAKGMNRDDQLIVPLLSYLAKLYGFVVLDLPGEIDETILKALTQSDLIFLITDEKRSNIELTKWLIDDLDRSVRGAAEKIKVVFNEMHGDRPLPADEKEELVGRRVYATLPQVDSQAGPLILLADPVSGYGRAMRRISRDVGHVMVGLALSSGAAMGLAHIGVLKVLEREKIPIDLIAGASIGAMFAGFWALGIPAEELEALALRFRKLQTLLLVDPGFPFRLGLLRGGQVMRFLKSVVGDKTFEDTQIPVKIIACNVLTRQEVVLEQGLLRDAIRASIAIPGIFHPHRRGDDLLIDGGVVDPLPVRVTVNYGARKVIAVNAVPSPEDVFKKLQKMKERERRLEERVARKSWLVRASYRVSKAMQRATSPNLFDIIMYSMQSMEYELARQSAQEADVAMHPVVPTTGWWEFFNGKELIARGEEETHRVLPQIKRLLGE